MKPSLIAEVVEHYHQLLMDEHLESTLEVLARRLGRGQLVFDGRSVCEVLRPRFIEAQVHEDAWYASRQVMKGLASLYRHAARDGALRRTLGLMAEEDALVRIDAMGRVPCVVSRLDGLLGEDGQLKFIEHNTTPGGIVFTDSLSAAFQEMPIIRVIANRYAMAGPSARAGLSHALRELRGLPGKNGSRSLTVIGLTGGEGGSELKNQSEARMLLKQVAEQGVRVTTARLDEEWSLRDGTLWREGVSVELILFASRAAAESLLREHGSDHPIVKAVQGGAAFVLNGMFRSALLYSKQLFAALSDPAFSYLFDADTATAFRRYIPWTRIVREGRTPYEGRTVDLLPFVAEHRERFVLKPGRGYGGDGVVLGWKCTSEQWARALQHFLEERPGVVQERVHVPTEAYPVLQEGRPVFEEHYGDLNPYVWGDSHAEGYCVRVARNPLLNMSAGEGQMVPLFVVDRR
ncbi:hypothetical protein JQX13_00125 [Archangium violaceum]|uniref:hypothetical protein n=1 Tax=Archangium violaceum TaxID=83451 RepID=UPI00193B2503|nr:hypothetical protein [Archangium violaceum]QRK08638.1 hypothetical protein JQX13_00125 [Archangium violaceum]